MNKFKHLKTVNQHRFKVLKFCIKVGIPMHGFKHDLSKFSKVEFQNSSKYYQGTSSPIFAQRINEDLYSSICVHHTNKNKHHFEYWIDIYKGNLLLTKIPFSYSLEYCVDMISASMVYMKDKFTRDKVLEYFLLRKNNYIMHPANKEFVIYTLNEYSLHGFDKIKKKILQPKYEEIMAKYPNTYIVKTNIIDDKYNKEPTKEEFDEYNKEIENEINIISKK